MDEKLLVFLHILITIEYLYKRQCVKIERSIIVVFLAYWQFVTTMEPEILISKGYLLLIKSSKTVLARL